MVNESRVYRVKGGMGARLVNQGEVPRHGRGGSLGQGLREGPTTWPKSRKVGIETKHPISPKFPAFICQNNPNICIVLKVLWVCPRRSIPKNPEEQNAAFKNFMVEGGGKPFTLRTESISGGLHHCPARRFRCRQMSAKVTESPENKAKETESNFKTQNLGFRFR